MNRILLPLLLFLFVTLSYGQQQEEALKDIKGKILHMNAPLPSVVVSNTSSDFEIVSDTDGSYIIAAKEGDILTFTYPGMNTLEIIVEDVTRILNIKMTQQLTKLKEVTVSRSRLKSQDQMRAEYRTNPNLINTAFGFIDTETSSVKMEVLNESNFNGASLCILDVLRARFSGVRVFGNCTNGGGITIRGIGSLNNASGAIYDVDGQIFRETPLFIMPENMERIAILYGFSATVRYGFAGGGGVVVINTKGANFLTEPGTKKPYDLARVRNNIFDGNVITANALEANAPNYLKKLRAAKNLEAAMAIYKEQMQRYSSSFHYAIDAHKYFKDVWNAMDFSEAVIQNQWDVFQDNPVALKALAYVYEEAGDFEMANQLYKDIFILRPHYAQSYLDLANSYRNIGNFKRAAAIFSRYDYLIQEGFIIAKDLAFTETMRREFDNLLDLHGKHLVNDRKSKFSNTKKENIGTRMVFEWNDSEAEFNLQFVNPQGHYYNWKHNQEANAERIRDEKLKGYSCEEYLIDDSLVGTWKVNTTYMGNKTLTPSYLKVTVYHNYGTASQSKEIRIFKLSLKNVSQELFTLSHSVKLASK
ncbi:hypothetical protein [Costertonia aggregata]|uniref:Uncharacterized protein n=1 Tax=Costertonia aggregata TaxID=343403 RepID=A0A7H9AUM1_9FLAO|nr:hypothetical protein [Costertonia aggregata]QLG47150.1 hypothetical protein HYG79_17885 [Costertonia aggregata]